MGLMRVVDQTALPPGRPVTSSLPRGPGPPAGRMAPGLNGSVIGGHAYSWPVHRLGVDQVGPRRSNFPSGLVLGLALGAAVGGILLSMAIAAVLCRKWYGRRRKSSCDFDLDDRLTITSSRSAPPTRSNSMDSGRRGKTQLVRSVTMDMLSIETEMTTIEPVQPTSPEGMTYSTQTGRGNGMTQQISSDISSSAYESDDSYDDKRDVPTSGCLRYSLDYIPTRCQLVVNLIRVKHLKGSEHRALRDPYVVVCLLPDEKNRQQSRTVRKTLDPTFNESFVFYVTPQDFSNRVVRMSVYDVDRRRVRHTLGHVFVDLSDLETAQRYVQWADLEPCAQYKGLTQMGDIHLTLTFKPAAEELRVSVDHLRDIPAFILGETEGIYVKVSLQRLGRTVSSKKTTVLYDVTAEGRWGFSEQFTFTVPATSLDSASVRVIVYLKSSSDGRGLPGREHGRVTLGSHLYAQHHQLAHWENMLANMRHPVSAWHRLSAPSLTIQSLTGEGSVYTVTGGVSTPSPGEG